VRRIRNCILVGLADDGRNFLPRLLHRVVVEALEAGLRLKAML
jgi:hypothetical protein